jgi:hypothetical protein
VKRSVLLFLLARRRRNSLLCGVVSFGLFVPAGCSSHSDQWRFPPGGNGQQLQRDVKLCNLDSLRWHVGFVPRKPIEGRFEECMTVLGYVRIGAE